MDKDCKKLRKICLKIREWMEKQPAVKEESITDWLLFEVSNNIPRFYYKSFSRNEEAKETGADWEWWIVFDDSTFRLRIQAKKLKIDNDNYHLLAYANRYGLQIEKLIENSKKDNFIPFYSFYTSKADQVRCGENRNNEGVYLDGAKDIYNRFILPGKKTLKFDDILKYTTPLSCILCCPITRHKDGGKGFKEFLISYYPEETILDDHNKNQILGEYKEMPKHIHIFLESVKEGLPDWWEKEFSSQIKEVNSLAVYDARKQFDNTDG